MSDKFIFQFLFIFSIKSRSRLFPLERAGDENLAVNINTVSQGLSVYDWE